MSSIRGTNIRFQLAKSIQFPKNLLDTSFQLTNRCFFSEISIQVDSCIGISRASLSSPLLIQQRVEKTKSNTIDLSVQDTAMAEAQQHKPLKPKAAFEAGNDPSDPAHDTCSLLIRLWHSPSSRKHPMSTGDKANQSQNSSPTHEPPTTTPALQCSRHACMHSLSMVVVLSLLICPGYPDSRILI